MKVAPRPKVEKVEWNGHMQWCAFYPNMIPGMGDTEEWAVSDYYAKNNVEDKYPRRPTAPVQGVLFE